VLAALLQAGHRPLLPFGAGHPYDIAFGENGQLRRVQCKTGRLIKGAVFFPTSSWCRDSNWRAYRDTVDFFGIYCPDTGEVYLVPIEDVPERGAHLRIEPTRNNQAKGVRWARDYVLTRASFLREAQRDERAPALESDDRAVGL
jgi:PD-(D/E)XK endonuclease